jgi:D-sedoheptulose 7-phosphate isomerase
VGGTVSRTRIVSTEGAIRSAIGESIEVKAQLLEQHVSTITRLAELLVGTLRAGGKLVLFGNGGSAADAQHVAAELVNRFLIDRDALAAIALTTDTSILTSVCNDADFDQVFSRQVRALVQRGDVAVGISTSGNSPNVVNGVIAAREKGATTVGFTGRGGGELKDLVDICFSVPSESTPRIQEAHITVWHAICEVVEKEMFGGG